MSEVLVNFEEQVPARQCIPNHNLWKGCTDRYLNTTPDCSLGLEIFPVLFTQSGAAASLSHPPGDPRAQRWRRGGLFIHTLDQPASQP